MAIKDNIEKAYLDIQNLQLQPTRTNVILLAEAMLNLEQASRELKEIMESTGKPETVNDCENKDIDEVV